MNPQQSNEPLSVLCVDDEKQILSSLAALFRGESFQLLTASSGSEGLTILEGGRAIGLILSDQQMPEMSGTDFLQAAAELAPDTLRIILSDCKDANVAIDAVNRAGVTHFLMKPWDDVELLQIVRDTVERYRRQQETQRNHEAVQRQRDELLEWNANLKKRIFQQTTVIRKQLLEVRQQSNVDILNTVSRNVSEVIVAKCINLLDLCHYRISNHSRIVAALAESMAESMNLTQAQCKEIRIAALLHDIGKIGMPDRILARGKELLNSDDLKEYRTHVIRGLTIIDEIEELRDVATFILHHHESFDGNGFPDGLAGEQIPLGSRIIALADWAENNFCRDGSPNAKYRVTKMIGVEMGRLFDPLLSSAANSAVIRILR